MYMYKHTCNTLKLYMYSSITCKYIAWCGTFCLYIYLMKFRIHKTTSSFKCLGLTYTEKSEISDWIWMREKERERDTYLFKQVSNKAESSILNQLQHETSWRLPQVKHQRQQLDTVRERERERQRQTQTASSKTHTHTSSAAAFAL